MTNLGDMKVEIMSKELFEKLFSSLCNPLDLCRIYLIRIIPMLKYLEKKS